jgi:UDP-glucose 4-epimerase
MRILLTGASSFTGYWFAKKLTDAGHEVHAPLRRSQREYVGTRAERLADSCQLSYDTLFGSRRFLELIRTEGPFDLLCHHAAEVKDYRSPTFDVAAAVAANTHQLPRVLELLGDARVVLTGTVFEPDITAYGRSKGLTTEIFREQCPSLTRFVIPHPFGPFEEPRFSAYLLREWAAGRVAHVKTPSYIRDNIHVSLLADAYVNHVEQPLPADISPSGYVESVGDFTARYAQEMRARLGWECAFTCADQTDFLEPFRRTGADLVPFTLAQERQCWDEIAQFAQLS